MITIPNGCGLAKKSDIQVGDYIKFMGSRKISGITGKVLKLNPKTIILECPYMNLDPLTIKMRYEDLTGQGFIKRGDLLYTIDQES